MGRVSAGAEVPVQGAHADAERSGRGLAVALVVGEHRLDVAAGELVARVLEGAGEVAEAAVAGAAGGRGAARSKGTR